MPRTSIRRSSRHRIAPSPWLAIPDEYFWYRRDGSLRARQTDRDRQLESHGPELGQSTRIAQGYLAFNRFSRMLRKIRSYVSWSPPAGRFTSIRTVRPMPPDVPLPAGTGGLLAGSSGLALGFCFAPTFVGEGTFTAGASPCPAKRARS